MRVRELANRLIQLVAEGKGDHEIRVPISCTCSCGRVLSQGCILANVKYDSSITHTVELLIMEG